jgi:hypothetical protein
MNKRVFQVIDEMNQDDSKNGTQMVIVGTNFISANKVHGGCSISIGMPEYVLGDLLRNEKTAILLLIDTEEYFKRMNEL